MDYPIISRENILLSLLNRNSEPASKNIHGTSKTTQKHDFRKFLERVPLEEPRQLRPGTTDLNAATTRTRQIGSSRNLPRRVEKFLGIKMLF